MMMNNTLAQLRELKLLGMATAVEEQLASPSRHDAELRGAAGPDGRPRGAPARRQARTRLLKRARLKYPQACIEDVDGRAGRGFERRRLMSLALSRWVEDGTAILVTGPTGSGKSWLACALAQYACRRGHSALYLRVPRLAEELRMLHGNGGFALAGAAGAHRRPGPRRLGHWRPWTDHARRSDGDHRRPRRHARHHHHQPVARRALACLDRRRDHRRRDPRPAAARRHRFNLEGPLAARTAPRQSPPRLAARD